eukprot:gene913-1151_t
MTTMVGTQSDFGKALRELVELDYDAIEAYKASIHRVRDQENRDILTSYMNDYNRNIQELSDLLKAHNSEIPSSGSTGKQLLKKGRVVISNITGDDGIFSAMSSNEDDTNKAFEKICNRQDIWEDSKDILQRGWDDAIKHKTGLDERRDLLKGKHHS